MRLFLEGAARKDYYERKKRGEGMRPPLRSLKELSEELGVPVRTLSGKLKMEGAPKPQVSRKLGGWVTSSSYYNPKEFKEWWKRINNV